MAAELPMDDEFYVSVEDLLSMPEIQQVLTLENSEASTSGTNPDNPSQQPTEPRESSDQTFEGMVEDDEKDEEQEERQQTTTQKTPTSPSERGMQTDELSTSTGQRVQTLSAVELDKLCRQLQSQIAVLSDGNKQKEETRQQKQLIQELTDKLVRLQELEAELNMYEQRSLESLHAELEMHKKQVAELSQQLADAGNVEREMITTVLNELHK